MSSDRPYRKGMPDEKLDSILRDGSGKQWDPKIIEAAFKVREELRTTEGVVVIFDRERGEFDMPALPELSRAMPLREQARFADATVYTLEGSDDQHVAWRQGW